MKLTVNLDKDSYDIHIEKGILDHILDYIQLPCNKITIITDSNVGPIYASKLQSQLSTKYDVQVITLEAGEKSKNINNAKELYYKLIDFHMTRTDIIIALGGGVIGDLAGFVAATYLRGIGFIQIPTSLLAQVDSSVGGKVAVDLEVGKNLVGAFKHPLLVLIDPNTLKTLTPAFISDGMGEVIKYGCIFDQSFFNQLNQYQDFHDLYKDIDAIVYKCVDLKRIVVENDLYDFGDRLSLNFGHTLGHAVETYYNFEKFSHGACVSIGMVALTKLAEEKGLTQSGTAHAIEQVVTKYGLPTTAGCTTSDIKMNLLKDKKNFNSSLSYVLLKEIGQYYVYKSDVNFIDEGKTI